MQMHYTLITRLSLRSSNVKTGAIVRKLAQELVLGLVHMYCVVDRSFRERKDPLTPRPVFKIVSGHVYKNKTPSLGENGKLYENYTGRRIP